MFVNLKPGCKLYVLRQRWKEELLNTGPANALYDGHMCTNTTVWYSNPPFSVISATNPIRTVVWGINSVVDEMASIFILSSLQSHIQMQISTIEKRMDGLRFARLFSIWHNRLAILMRNFGLSAHTISSLARLESAYSLVEGMERI